MDTEHRSRASVSMSEDVGVRTFISRKVIDSLDTGSESSLVIGPKTLNARLRWLAP